ncbi:sensor histidine kinase [Cupriavidus basilensis]
MAGIAGYAELLSAAVSRRRIRAAASTMPSMPGPGSSVPSLSDLPRPGPHRSPQQSLLERERVEVAALCARSIVAAEFAGQGRVHVIAASAPLHVLADRAQLTQAVRNLIENALKYSDGKEEVTVTVAPLAQGQDKVSVRVEDRGIGMTKEEAGLAFDNFYRANRQGNTTGNGLGLAIVREIVAVHQGQITLSSELGKGTVVTLGPRRRQRRGAGCGANLASRQDAGPLCWRHCWAPAWRYG